MNIKDKLPSKNFIRLFLFFFIAVGLIFAFSFLFSKKEKFVSADNLKINKGKTIEYFLKKDTDGDGVYDWEEDLWGTDKNKRNTFGIDDKEYIRNKKRELQIQEELNLDEMSQTDRFAREFFSSYAALRSSGEIDDLTITSFYNSLGQRIVNPVFNIKYKESDLIIEMQTSKEYMNVYYQKIIDTFGKHKDNGIGEELNIISEGLLSYSNTSQNNLKSGELILISEAYREFAEDFIKIKTPDIVKKQHLNVANNAYNLSLSVLNMSKVINDPLIGLSGLSNYQKFSEELVNSIQQIEIILGF